jgi:hypothetical protein
MVGDRGRTVVVVAEEPIHDSVLPRPVVVAGKVKKFIEDFVLGAEVETSVVVYELISDIGDSGDVFDGNLWGPHGPGEVFRHGCGVRKLRL